MNDRISIHICTKDRHSELGLLFQSLRSQTIQDWDLILLDESQTPITMCYFLSYLINRLKLENHKIKLIRNDTSQGVCYARNQLIENDTFKNKYTLRLDDDVVLEPNYIFKLRQVITEKFYDMASGVVPPISNPNLEREIRFVKPIINKHEFDKKGKLVKQNDDCGYCYIEKEILPSHQFRTNCLYKSEINNKVKYPQNLTFTGFREEGFFSIKAILEGYKIGINTGAVCYHFSCPSGGVRFTPEQYKQNVNLDNETFTKWLKQMFDKHGDFFEEYNKKVVK